VDDTMVRRIGLLVTILTSATLFVGVARAGAPKDDWPRINGELWINSDDLDISHTGTRKNDELLGGHGADRIHGGRGKDVIWGDHKATGNTTRQRDFVRAGAGDDWVYASHGHNTIHGGAGDDTIRVWFGRGVVDCGPGNDDILYVSHASGPNVKRRNCETLSHKSAKDAIHDRDD
jgi:Ca2+-binding RTX toxin-like protein